MRVTGKTISLEAARLLSIPFTWGGGRVAFRYAHSAQGLEVWSREHCATKWSLETYDGLDGIAAMGEEFLVVEFEDEREVGDVD